MSERYRTTAEALASISGATLRTDLSGRDVTTFAIGGPLRGLLDCGSIAQLEQAVRIIADSGMSSLVIGGGSNLLIDDAGLDCWVLRLSPAFKTLQLTDDGLSETVEVTVGASYPLMALSREMCGRGFAGLAFAGGIPASLGGAVRMNAGAHGGEMSQVIEWVDVVTGAGDARRLSRDEMNFSYRHSAIGPSDIVVAARLLLQRSSAERVSADRAHCLEERRARQPLSQPSAGSVFKNPSPQESAGSLIERVGLKGFQLGEVMISEKHANWIVNPQKRGRADQVRALISLCQERVEKQFGIELQPEIITLFGNETE